jgi:glycosidase
LLLVLSACDTGGSPATPTVTTAPAKATAFPVASATATSGTTAATTATPGQAAVAPMWARDAVLYQVFVRAFTPDGTLAAAKQRLGDLKDLGVNLIYLMPIHPIGKVSRKGSLGSPYSIQDYQAIDPALGTEADLKAFVDAAHGLGMHVIMDLVANHTAWDSVLATGHPDWYAHTSDGKFRPPMPDWADVIQLDHSNPALLQYMIDMTSHYVTVDGVDGFRCDYSVGVPIPFWVAWRTAIKKVRPDVFLLSENDDQSLTAAFDATYDQHTYQDIVTAYLRHKPHLLIVDPLSDRQQFGANRLRVRFLENHDHDRVALAYQAASPQALQAASTYLLTTDDIPFIENGEELGITHTLSLFEPDKVNWQIGSQDLRAVFKKDLQIRNGNPALRDGDIADGNSSDPGVLAFVRSSPDQQVLVLISFAADKTHVTIDPQLSKHAGKDLASGAAVDLSAGVDMPAWSWRFIELK